MPGNKEVLDLPVVPVADDGYIYIVKDGVNYRVPAGTALGLATLGADGVLTAAQRPESTVTETGDLIQGSGVILSGTLTDRLVGTGNVTITASGGSASSVAWGAITGTLSSQADLQAALDAKASTSHTHTTTDVTSGTFIHQRIGTGLIIPDLVLKATAGTSPSWGSLSWGDIAGTLANQTDLQTALNEKSNTGHTHAGTDITSGTVAPARLGLGSSITTKFLRGDSTWQTVLTSDTNYAKLNAANVFTQNQSAPDFISTSDERLKYNIVDVVPRDRLADMLRFVSFIYTATDEERLGLIAQDVLKVAPEYVHVNDAGYLGIDKAGIALEAIIGLAKRVRELEAKVK